MGSVDRQLQKKITSDHLKNGMPFENWLIPFAVTISLLVLALLVMLVLYFVKYRRSTSDNSDDRRQGYKYAATESDETMTKLTETTRSEQVVEMNASCSSPARRESHNSIVVQSRRVEALEDEQYPPPYGWSIRTSPTTEGGNNTQMSEVSVGFPHAWDNMPASNL